MNKAYYKYGFNLHYIPSRPCLHQWSADTVRQWRADPNRCMWYDMEANTLYANGKQVQGIISLCYYHNHPIANVSFECSSKDVETRYVGYPHLTEIHHLVNLNGIWLQVEHVEQHGNTLIVCCQAQHRGAEETKEAQREGYSKV